MNAPSQAYKLKEAANLLNCSMPTIYRMIRAKELKTFKVRGDQRVTAAEISRIQSGE